MKVKFWRIQALSLRTVGEELGKEAKVEMVYGMTFRARRM